MRSGRAPLDGEDTRPHTNAMDRKRTRTALAGAAWLLAGMVFVIVEAVAATQFTPAYDYAVNYISELGVVGCVDTTSGVQACTPLVRAYQWHARLYATDKLRYQWRTYTTVKLRYRWHTSLHATGNPARHW